MTQADTAGATPPRPPSLLDPLREKVFRRVWTGSLLSNFGQLVQGVGAAWEMTRLTAAPDKVALVQTAIMLPLMLVSLPAGAFADMFDRRKIALVGLGFACASAATLTLCAALHLVTPWVLLGFCFLIGAGVALYGPAWQASVGEQVSARHLPAAIALGSISYNVARSFGPAIGGLVVATAGALAAFGINALLYVPLIVVFATWRRVQSSPRLPPERIDRAIISGARYAVHSPPLRTILLRTLASGLAGASVSALTPLVAKYLLGGGAGTYGLLLGAYGVGAVGGAFLISPIRERMKTEHAARLCALVSGAMIVVVGLSRDAPLTYAAMFVAGAGWMLLIALFNVGVQLSVPRWVTARALAGFQSAITGGMAFGAWGWGHAAGHWGIGTALVTSGIVVMATPLIGLALPMPGISAAETAPAEAYFEPEVRLGLTPRSGPVVIEVDYRVEAGRARDFYGAMQLVRGARLRSGGFEWSLARDIADPELWTERYHCPTWGDYLRQRSRATQADRQAQEAADRFNQDLTTARVRRRLERPFGSVRWRADVPDTQIDRIAIYAPP